VFRVCRAQRDDVVARIFTAVVQKGAQARRDLRDSREVGTHGIVGVRWAHIGLRKALRIGRCNRERSV